MKTKVLISETVHHEADGPVHTIHIKEAPPEIVTVDGIECYLGRDGHPYVADGPAKGVAPNSYMYWLYLERWDMLPNRPKCSYCDQHHIAPDSKCPNTEWS